MMNRTKSNQGYLLRLGLTRPFYSPGEVAELAGLHPGTILNYIHRGRLFAVKLSERTYRIPVRAVAKFLYPDKVPPPRVIEGREAREAIARIRRRLAREEGRPREESRQRVRV